MVKSTILCSLSPCHFASKTKPYSSRILFSMTHSAKWPSFEHTKKPLEKTYKAHMSRPLTFSPFSIYCFKSFLYTKYINRLIMNTDVDLADIVADYILLMVEPSYIRKRL